MGVVPPSKGLAQGCRLNDSLIGKLLGGGSHDGEARRRLVATRHAGCFGGKLGYGLLVGGGGAVTLCGLLLKPLLDEMALLFPNAHAPLELLLHYRVLGDKTGREACYADLLDAQAVPSGQGPSSIGAGVGALGQVEFPGAVSAGRHLWRARLFLNDNLGGSAGISRCAGGRLEVGCASWASTANTMGGARGGLWLWRRGRRDFGS